RAPTEIYHLSLHDALPICESRLWEKRAVALLRSPDAGVERVDVEAQDEHPAAPALHPRGVLRPARDDSPWFARFGARAGDAFDRDRKSTRLNSSHGSIPYA